MDSGDIIMTCPYNKAHSIISSRMQFHLTKCRAQYPNAEKTLCPFNTTHVINKIELEYHRKICDDRIVLGDFMLKVGNEPTEIKSSKLEQIEITGGETWDDTVSESVLEKVHEASKSKPALQALIGAPRSERKAFRTQERLRIQRVLDGQRKAELAAAEAAAAAASANKRAAAAAAATAAAPVPARDARRRQENVVANVPRENLINRRVTCESSSDEEHIGYGDQLVAARQRRNAAARQPRNAASRQEENAAANVAREEYDYRRENPDYRHFGFGDQIIKEADTDSGKSLGAIKKSSAQFIRNPKNPWRTNYVSLGDTSPQEDVAFNKSFDNLKMSPSPPIRERDPENPWCLATRNEPVQNETSVDQSDFPKLPIASRGRGRNRMSSIKTKSRSSADSYNAAFK